MPNYEKTPAPIAAVHEELWTEVVMLHRTLLAFRALYATDDATVDILNRTAGSFFELVQDVLIDSLILHICRLTDPPGSGGRTNLTLTRLATELEANAPPRLTANVTQLLAQAETQSAPMRRLRDKRIAHTDLQVRRGEAALGGLQYGQLEAVIGTFRKIMDTIELHFEHRTTGYEAFTATGDAKSLVFALQRGEECHKRERQAQGW